MSAAGVGGQQPGRGGALHGQRVRTVGERGQPGPQGAQLGQHVQPGHRPDLPAGQVLDPLHRPDAEAALTNAKGRLKTIPAKIPANQLDPNAQRAILRTRRRSLQMVLRLLAFNAEQWLADRLNAYLADNDEYRATLRHLLHLGGHITYTTKTITVALDPPPTPKITRALRLLLAELNTTPPRIPGDHRPITYAIKTA